MPGAWQVNLLLHVDQADEIIKFTEAQLAEDSEYAFECKRCQHRPLRPWDGDDVWVLNYHLEEHYGINLEEPGKMNPSKKLRKKIFSLYGDHCFRCGETKGLHIDHLRPRAKGGDGAFRNLQPLCERCGNLKGDREPAQIEVFNPIYFMPQPSDSWPNLFW